MGKATEMDIVVQLFDRVNSHLIVPKIMDLRRALKFCDKEISQTTLEKMIDSLISENVISGRDFGLELRSYSIHAHAENSDLCEDKFGQLVKAYAKWLHSHTQESHSEETSMKLLMLAIWIYDQISNDDAGMVNEILRNLVPKLHRTAVDQVYLDLTKKNHPAAVPIAEGLVKLIGVNNLLTSHYEKNCPC
ncbi:TPA: hypothetical protein DD449_04175 [Candidatus Berkelbacteria bacterium]|uniref:Uncharacterized protein n=1 Tax=Berkelbacteria bacterium GW2011_GWE1_39_12 TaxID=1618337 RepID=A0A0G4B2V3_9BACT|nr:MAG: hypothetical protein UT28_C0001G0456 [Berkelbacteria bacterium GW2011_GWE1_39_12]HBO60852.1 hypothetical protein [Candidatus Berkelbacteria bacterium]